MAKGHRFDGYPEPDRGYRLWVRFANQRIVPVGNGRALPEFESCGVLNRALVKRFIHYHTKPGDLILDPFCGGGSTLEAATRMGRRSLGFEIDPHWADYTRRRMASVTPSMFTEAE